MAEIVSLPSQPTEYREGKHAVIRSAISDPGAFVGRLRWPDPWGYGAWEYESLPNWQARAVSAALHLPAEPLGQAAGRGGDS